MEKFNRTLRGYDPDEVNNFLDEIIGRVEKMVSDIDSKNETIKNQNSKIEDLENKLKETESLKEKLSSYERMESTLNQAIFMAQKTSDQLKVAAHRESEIIIDGIVHHMYPLPVTRFINSKENVLELQNFNYIKNLTDEQMQIEL